MNNEGGSLNVLKKISEWRSQHGILLKDYDTYHKYCTWKIAALRKGLPLAWVQKASTKKKLKGSKRKGKFRARTAVPQDAEYKRKYLLLFLLLAERSWSVASSVELALLRGRRLSGAPVRKYIIRHLGMAVRWLHQFWEAFASRVKADKLTAMSFQLYSAEATARWLSLRNRHLLALRKSSEGLAYASAMRSLHTRSDAELIKKTASLYDLKRISERSAANAGVEGVEIQRLAIEGNKDGLEELRSLGCRTDDREAVDLTAVEVTPFKIVLGERTVMLELKSEALLMRISGAVKCLDRTHDTEDRTECINEIQETINDLQDTLFTLPSSSDNSPDRKEIEDTIRWLQLTCLCLSLSSKIKLLIQTLRSLQSTGLKSLASHVPFLTTHRDSERGQAFVDTILLSKLKPEIPVKLVTAAQEAEESSADTLKSLLKTNIIPQDILDALKNTKALFLSILCLLNFQFEQAYVLTKLASERCIEQPDIPILSGGGVLAAPILELHSAGREFIEVLSPVSWTLQALTLAVLLSKQSSDLKTPEERIQAVKNPLPPKPRVIYPGPRVYDLVEEIKDLQILKSSAMHVVKDEDNSHRKADDAAAASQPQGLFDRLRFWR